MSSIASSSTIQVPHPFDLHSPECWVVEAKALLDQPSDRPIDWISCLAKHPKISELLNKDAGVRERFTVGEHTSMVLKIACEYRETFESDVSTLLSWNEFLFFLSLHDIGKGIALEKDKVAAFTSIRKKENELQETRDIVYALSKELDIAERKIRLFIELLRYDTQGEYLKDKISIHEAIDKIIENAIHAEVSPIDFYSLFAAFHACDAASYPYLMHHIFSIKNGRLEHKGSNAQKISELRAVIYQIEQGKIAFELLLEEVDTRKDTIEKTFIENLHSLQKYLEYSHKTLLMMPVDQRIDRKTSFKKLKFGFKHILRRIIELNGSIQVEKYIKIISKSLGNHNGTDTLTKKNSFLFLFSSEENEDELLRFCDELMNFRKSYLCRYSMQKVVRVIQQNLNSDDDNEQAALLLGTTFFHGTNSSNWPNLHKTALNLIPTGQLKKMGIVPLSGELKNGCTHNGVNQARISGCSLDRIEIPISYASSSCLSTELSREKRYIEENIFIHVRNHAERPIFIDCYDCMDGPDITRAAFAVRKIKSVFPEEFQGLLPELEEASEVYHRAFEDYKKTENYRQSISDEPETKGALEDQGESDSWNHHFTLTEKAIQDFKSAVMEKCIPTYLSENEKTPYPLVFASSTLHTWLLRPNKPMERCAVRKCKLGKDIQMIFTSKEHQPLVRENLKVHSLDKSVEVLDIELLDYAQRLNAIASPYFADCLSLLDMNDGSQTQDLSNH